MRRSLERVVPKAPPLAPTAPPIRRPFMLSSDHRTILDANGTKLIYAIRCNVERDMSAPLSVDEADSFMTRIVRALNAYDEVGPVDSSMKP